MLIDINNHFAPRVRDRGQRKALGERGPRLDVGMYHAPPEGWTKSQCVLVHSSESWPLASEQNGLMLSGMCMPVQHRATPGGQDLRHTTLGLPHSQASTHDRPDLLTDRQMEQGW